MAKSEDRSAIITKPLKCALPSGGGANGQVDDSNGESMAYGTCPNTDVRPQGKEHIQTPPMSFKDMNVNLYAPLYGTADKLDEYMCHDYVCRGTTGYGDRSAIIGRDVPKNSGNGGNGGYLNRINGSYPSLNPVKQPTTREEEACVNRVKLSQAADQEIMSAALYPFNNYESDKIAWEKGLSQPGMKMSDSGHCQTYPKVYDPQGEYYAGKYVKLAYDKTLVDPRTREHGGSTTASKEKPENKLLAWLISNAQAALTNGYDEAAYPDGIKPFEHTDKYQGQSDKALAYQTINPYLVGTNNTAVDSNSGGKGKEAMFYLHPFGPREDYKYNERDEFSPKGAMYSTYEQDNVACADLAKPGNARVKVDILDFRRPPFEQGMNKRISLDQQCWENSGAVANPCCKPTSTGCIPQPCWKCFTGGQQKADDASVYPPCATTHDKIQKDDLSILPQFIPTSGALNGRKLQCGESAASLCEKARAPLWPLNQFVLRRDQCGNPKNQLNEDNGKCMPENTDGWNKVTTYFGNRMPYMVQSDTGHPIRDNEGSGYIQDAFDYAGQYTAIVGVGAYMNKGGSSGGSVAQNEPKSILDQLISPAYAVAVAGGGAGNPLTSSKDMRCKYGGWGQDTDCAGMHFNGPDSKSGAKADPVTGWTEFKQYYANGIRKYSINCVLQYEKAFAPMDASYKVSARAGSTYERPICSQKNKDGTSTACSDSGSSGGSGSSGSKYEENRGTQTPIAFRGQSCLPQQIQDDMKKPLNQRNCFPNFGAKEEPKLIEGADNALPGDILILPTGGVGKSNGYDGGDNGGKKPLWPTLAYVVSVNNSQSDKGGGTKCGDHCSIIVSTANDGLYPDTCGQTTTAGSPSNRTIYKPGGMPDSLKQRIMKLEGNQNPPVTDKNVNCEWPQLGFCELESWDSVKIYRPSQDVRDK